MTTKTKTFPFFVYGILRPDYARGGYHKQGLTPVAKATVRGDLMSTGIAYVINVGKPDAGTVIGWVVEVDDETRFDNLEGYRPDRPASENAYNRIHTIATLEDGTEVDVQMYEGNFVNPYSAGAKLVESGDWFDTNGIREAMERRQNDDE